eukprot:TRINITY_DN2345_c0_g1_i1.p1 TRINITY_DN2345_c0_g1~~TRINITY_DN2345_c0_g1_i1.p1  ORF type:complete len:222 (-),score=46.01 TRINITY_DN2345_c0_g1_i1:62-727(-)
MKALYSLLVAFLYVTVASGILFEVKVNQRRCIQEEIREHQLVTGSYEVSDKLSRNAAYPYEQISRALQMAFSVEDPKGTIVFQNLDAKAGTFGFTGADEAGLYNFCFKDSQRPGAPTMQIPSRTVSVSLKTGNEGPDYAEIAKKDNLQPLELELRKIEDSVDRIKDEMLIAKNREEAMRDTNESTNSRVAWLTVFCFAVLAGSTVWQILYLKKYFQQKKLI